MGQVTSTTKWAIGIGATLGVGGFLVYWLTKDAAAAPAGEQTGGFNWASTITRLVSPITVSPNNPKYKAGYDAAKTDQLGGSYGSNVAWKANADDPDWFAGYKDGWEATKSLMEGM